MKPACKILYVLFLISAFQNRYGLQAQTVKSAQALYSDSLYAFFLQKGFEPEKQLLQNTFSQDFPYNVVISVNKNKGKKKLIVAIPQQDVQPVLSGFAELIQKLPAQFTDLQTDFVFTANDLSPAVQTAEHLQQPVHQNAGTLTYINALETEEDTAALIIRTTEKKQNTPLYRKNLVEIVPGGTDEYDKGSVCPHFFFKVIINACNKANTDYHIKGHFLSLYRLGFIKPDTLLSAWLSANIPAILFNIHEANSAYIFNIIENCMDEYRNVKTNVTDTHYSTFRIFKRTFFVSEKMYVVFLTAASAVTLFLFFVLSFIYGTHRRIHREEFFKTWYLIPLTIGTTALLLFFAQFVTVNAIGKHAGVPLFFLLVKTAFAVTFFTLGFFPLTSYIFKLPVTGFIYGYLLLPAAFLNIFLFAAVDIALVPLFIIEYIIVYISRSMRNAVPLVCCLIFMLLPYAPFIHAVAFFDPSLTVRFIGGAGFVYNALFAAVLLPFLIMIVRILIRFKLWKIRGKEAKHKIRKQAAFAFLFFTCFFSSVFAISFFIQSEQKKRSAQKKAESIQSVSLVGERTVQFERSILTLNLSSELPVIRYYIEVSSQAVLPVFESNYPYDIFLKPFTAVFALDDYPPHPFMLTFSADGMHDILCSVTAYVRTNTGIQTEKLSYTITGLQQ